MCKHTFTCCRSNTLYFFASSFRSTVLSWLAVESWLHVACPHTWLPCLLTLCTSAIPCWTPRSLGTGESCPPGKSPLLRQHPLTPTPPTTARASPRPSGRWSTWRWTSISTGSSACTTRRVPRRGRSRARAKQWEEGSRMLAPPPARLSNRSEKPRGRKTPKQSHNHSNRVHQFTSEQERGQKY